MEVRSRKWERARPTYGVGMENRCRVLTGRVLRVEPVNAQLVPPVPSASEGSEVEGLVPNPSTAPLVSRCMIPAGTKPRRGGVASEASGLVGERLIYYNVHNMIH